MTAPEAIDEIHRHLSKLMDALSLYVDHADSDDAKLFKIVKHLTDAERLLTALSSEHRSKPDPLVAGEARSLPPR